MEKKIVLETHGILVSLNKVTKPFKVNVISAVAPARAGGTIYFNHMKSCSKCDQKCDSIGKKTIYQTEVGNIRTEESFVRRQDVDHLAKEFKKTPTALKLLLWDGMPISR